MADCEHEHFSGDPTRDLYGVELCATTLAANLSTLSDMYDIDGLATLRDQAWAVAFALRGMLDMLLDEQEAPSTLQG